ncbi:hypothetical protein E5D57_013352 [Metarhizium anisopliae]|nr:hypothetical protein E5D57_013352 [Metarhizium anisopliae]
MLGFADFGATRNDPRYGFSIFEDHTAQHAKRNPPFHVLQDVTEPEIAREYLPQDARVVMTTNGRRPRFIHGHWKDIEQVPAAVVVKQTPQTASFKFSLNSTIICECYFAPFEDDITIANSGPGSLEYGRLFGGRLSQDGVKKVDA